MGRNKMTQKTGSEIYDKLKKAMLPALGILLASCMPQQQAPQSVPSASVETQVEKAQRVHEDVLVLDAHADIVLPETSKTYLASDGLSKVHPDKLRAGKVDAVVMAIAVDPGPRTKGGDAAAKAEANAKLAKALKIANLNEDIVIETDATEIRAATSTGKNRPHPRFSKCPSAGWQCQ